MVIAKLFISLVTQVTLQQVLYISKNFKKYMYYCIILLLSAINFHFLGQLASKLLIPKAASSAFITYIDYYLLVTALLA